jgi:hypothetical protein
MRAAAIVKGAVPNSLDNRTRSRFPPIVGRATTRTVLSVMGDSAANPGIGVDRKREVVHALTQWLLFVCAWLGLNGTKQQILKTHITDKATGFFICDLLDNNETGLGHR